MDNETIVYNEETRQGFKDIGELFIKMGTVLRNIKNSDQLKEFNKLSKESLEAVDRNYPEVVKLLNSK